MAHALPAILQPWAANSLHGSRSCALYPGGKRAGDNHAAALFLSDGLLARQPHRADGGRYRGALPSREYLGQESHRGRRRLPGGLAQGCGAGAGEGGWRAVDRKRRRAAIHRRPQAGAWAGAPARRRRPLSPAGVAELRRLRDPQGVPVSGPGTRTMPPRRPGASASARACRLQPTIWRRSLISSAIASPSPTAISPGRCCCSGTRRRRRHWPSLVDYLARMRAARS